MSQLGCRVSLFFMKDFEFVTAGSKGRYPVMWCIVGLHYDKSCEAHASS